MKNKIILPIILTIIFSILKVCGAINWEFMWIISPMWIFLLGIVFIYAIALLIIIFGLIFGFTLQEIVDASKKYQESIRNKYDKK